jgi:hypothetical protein
MKPFIAVFIALGVFGGGFPVSALAVDLSTNPLLQEKPVWFAADTMGGFYGATESGYTFTQRPVANEWGIRIHKFMIGTTFFYISDRGVIDAPDDLAALSIYFSLG